MKVNDIRPDDVMAGQQAAMQADIDWLAARRDRFVKVSCPACGADDCDTLYEKYGMSHVGCRACGTQYVNPRPDAATLRAFYASSANYAYWAKHVYPASKAARREKIFRPRAEIVVRVARERGVCHGVLLEVGAAYGLFCDEIRKTGVFARIIGIEPTPDLAHVCRGLGIETIESSYEDARIDSPVDVVVNFEVIEHLFAPAAFARWCHGVLKPGGYLVLTCPNIAGFETILLGRASTAVDHQHLNLFTPDSLTRLVRRCGFEAVEVTTPGRLDVELVQRGLADGRVTDEDLGPLWTRLLRCEDDTVHERLQLIVQDAKLSSNMMLVARRPLPGEPPTGGVALPEGIPGV